MADLYVGEPRMAGGDRLFAGLIYPVKQHGKRDALYRASTRQEADAFIAGYRRGCQDKDRP